MKILEIFEAIGILFLFSFVTLISRDFEKVAYPLYGDNVD